MVNNIKSQVLSDQEVIEGIANGSTSELEYLYASYFPMIFQLVTKNNGSEDDAKDIFQEAVIVLYDRINSGDFVLSSKLKTFLYSVCRRLWLKRLNKNDRMSFNIQEQEIVAVESDLLEYQQKEEQFLLMEQSLHLLGEPCQTIISDFYLRNLSMQEICEKFGYTNADNAKTQKYKCLQRLKKLFFS